MSSIKVTALARAYRDTAEVSELLLSSSLISEIDFVPAVSLNIRVKTRAVCFREGCVLGAGAGQDRPVRMWGCVQGRGGTSTGTQSPTVEQLGSSSCADV